MMKKITDAASAVPSASPRAVVESGPVGSGVSEGRVREATVARARERLISMLIKVETASSRKAQKETKKTASTVSSAAASTDRNAMMAR